MKRLRPFLVAFAVFASIPTIALALFQQQRAQITVTITINVTPAPIAMRGSSAASDTSRHDIAAAAQVRLNDGRRATFSAQNLSFVSSNLVAQSQGSIKTEAEVSPNPTGTLLTSNQTGVILNQVAGTTVVYPCVYTVTVDTTQTNWSLDQGLFSDFLGATFPGKDIGNNSYLSTPHPTATPFIVYSDGQNWTLLQANGGLKTYCVDLTVTIPAAVPGGTYSSNAVYTLLY